ncbi:hypothetical protein KZX46_15765 [Polymorphobacter sp. PAMC 29334]|uniref:hypothetical protein n=1 Tax=Polymorphobacter sp. PAMC 29334 TaxID=2862331 RepID=UPI001C759D0F|nr:hypothetical protein [Polymorphobacter sp. PAMC 29334]QYE34224.1 hypothetical protein KZX46_15765 [Polymorphobacter sp. PAMC 29334]
MTAATNITDPSRRADVLTASGIIGLILLMLLMVMHHPVARQTDAAGVIGSIARQASADRFVHGTLAAAITVMTSLMLGFAMRLGLARPHVLLGAVASALALVLISLAVLLDGFVAPALALRCMTIGKDCVEQTEALLRYGGLQIEFLTRLALLALAAATALWAGDLILRRDGPRIAGILGLCSAAVQFGLLTFGGERLNVQNISLILTAQVIWYASVGTIIVLRQGPYASTDQG